MSFEESLKSVSLDADSSLAGYTGVAGQPGGASPHYGKALFRFVKVTGAKQVGRVDANTDRCVGVCQNKPQEVGSPATVAISGITNILSGAAIAAGRPITSDSQGRAVDATGVNGAVVYGESVDAVAGAGHLIPVLLKVS